MKRAKVVRPIVGLKTGQILDLKGPDRDGDFLVLNFEVGRGVIFSDRGEVECLEFLPEEPHKKVRVIENGGWLKKGQILTLGAPDANGDYPITSPHVKNYLFHYQLDLVEVLPEESQGEVEPQEEGSGYDNVDKPKHYQLHEGYEVVDLRRDLAKKAQANNVPLIQYSHWDRALEYLIRMWEKNGVEDAKKARVYLNWLIDELEG